jgi:hypothetical protein
MKFLILFLFISGNSCLCAQKSTDVKDIFKMWLFMDRMNVSNDRDSLQVSKNYLLFKIFQETVDLKLDTLKSELLREMGYEFYSIRLDTSILWKDMPKRLERYLLLFTGTFNTFVLAVHPSLGKSYRLVGFNGNDFFNFLSDVKSGNSFYPYPISQSDFFKSCKVDGVDFKCLYKGLSAKQVDKILFPCLNRVSDPIIIH